MANNRKRRLVRVFWHPGEVINVQKRRRRRGRVQVSTQAGPIENVSPCCHKRAERYARSSLILANLANLPILSVAREGAGTTP